MDVWQPAYVGVGSNLEQPRAQVERAFQLLRGLPRTHLMVCSHLYQSSPLGPVAQPDFVNAAVGLLTRLTAAELLAQLKALEAAAGRPAQRQRWGPRVLDLDLLAFGQERCAGPQLTLPHAGIVERNFVLYPLHDVAPDLYLPGLGRVTELKDRVTPEGLKQL